MGAGSSMNYVVEKLGEKGREMGAGSLMNYVVEKLGEKGREMGAENWMNFALEKLKEFLVVLEDFGGSLIGKVGEVFHRLPVATPYIIAGVGLVMFLCCCCRGGKGVKMMKAPGRNYRMPRPSFESNPRSYFRGLRGKR